MTRQLFIGDREYFSGIGRIQYEGSQSKNPLAFKAYDASRVIAGKTMEEHLRFCLLYTSPSPRDQRGSRMPSSA